MNNKFDNNLKKALTEYEKEIVNTAEKNSKKSDVFIIKKKWIKYAVGIAAVFVIFLPAAHLGNNLLNDNFVNAPAYVDNNNVENKSSEDLENPNHLDDSNNLPDEVNKEVATNGKFIESLDVTTETFNFEKSIEDINKTFENYKGYVESQDINNVKNEYHSGRTANFTYKIPNEDLDKFLDDLKKLDLNIISSNKSIVNVTNSYEDLSKDLELVNTKLESLQGLLSKATSLSDIIELEGKIQEVQSEKSSIENSLSSLDKDINLSTVNVSISEVDKYSGTENSNSGFLNRIKQAFKDSSVNFVSVLQDSVVGIIILLPFVIIVAIVIFIIFKLKKNKKIKTNKKED